MSLFRSLYDVFNDSKFDRAKELMSQGKYKECITNIYDNSSLLEPSSITVEGYWYCVQCYMKLEDYNMALQEINLILDYPSNDDDIKYYKRKAQELDKEIRHLQSTLSDIVKYPQTIFWEFISDEGTSNKDFEVCYEGLSKTIGQYYIRNSFRINNQSNVFTIYLKPISDNEVELFVYFDYIYQLFQRKEDDPIVYNVLIHKLEYLQRLIDIGKNGSTSRFSIYRTTDYGRDVVNKYRVPVLGIRCSVNNSGGCTLDDFEEECTTLLDIIARLEEETSNINSSDWLKIASIAFAKGALGKVAGQEIVPPFLNAIKSIFR